ncbi:MAG: hypothetical protein Q8N81_01440 [bacterium]|nr:hypothetical protein [bacterium]
MTSKLPHAKWFWIGSVILVLVAVAVTIGYVRYRPKPRQAVETNVIKQAGNSMDNLSKEAAKGALPSIDPKSNPLEKAPDVNPYSKTNPYADIKTNPFK